MRILQVSAEFFPLLQTGGLADVAGALPWALRETGSDVRVLLPGFPAIVAGVQGVHSAAAPSLICRAPWGDSARVVQGWIERRVGGLADSVNDASAQALADGGATGFVFERFALDDFVGAIGRALALFLRPRQLHQLREQAMRCRFDWAGSVAKYLTVYRQLLRA